MGRSVRRLFATCLITLLGGCGLLDPHRHADSVLDYKYQPGQQASTSLAEAINAARDQERLYLQAVSEYSFVNNASPLLVGGLALSSLLLGASGGGTTELHIGLAGAAAGAFGLSRVYDNQPRQHIWLNGAAALNCAVAANQPLLALGGPKFESDLNALESALHRLAALSLLNRRGARRDNNDIAKVKTDAANDIAAGEKLQIAIANAALDLRQKISAIQLAVDTQIISTNPDPTAVFGLLSSSLSAIQGLLPNTPIGPPQGQANAAGAGDAVDTAADNVDAARIIFEADLFPLAQFESIKTTLAQCQVAAPPVAFSLSPPVAARTVSPGDSWNYLIVGATGDVSAVVLNVPSKDFTVMVVQQPSSTGGSNSALLTISVAADATTPESATLQISDKSAQRPLTVQLNVVGKKSGTTPAPAAQATSFTKYELDVVRRNLGLPETGQPSLSADEKTKLTSTYSDNKNLTTTLFNKIYLAEREKAKATPPTVQPPNVDEIALVPGQSAVKLRAACGLPAVPVQADGETDAAYAKRIFAADLRSNLFDTQDSARNLPITGLADDTTGGAILGGKIVCKAKAA